MNRATLVSTNFVSSDTISHQGTYQSIKRYLKNGYIIKQERNGFWILIKPAQVLVILKDVRGNLKMFNMKEDILKYYGRTRISENLAERFENDVEQGKIQIFMDEDGCCLE